MNVAGLVHLGPLQACNGVGSKGCQLSLHWGLGVWGFTALAVNVIIQFSHIILYFRRVKPEVFFFWLHKADVVREMSLTGFLTCFIPCFCTCVSFCHCESHFSVYPKWFLGKTQIHSLQSQRRWFGRSGICAQESTCLSKCLLKCIWYLSCPWVVCVRYGAEVQGPDIAKVTCLGSGETRAPPTPQHLFDGWFSCSGKWNRC